MREPLSITSLLAAYGAVLSSFALGWNFYRDLRDRAKLKVTAGIRRIVHHSARQGIMFVSPNLAVAGKSKELFVVLTVTNTGRRPVRWDALGGEVYEVIDGKPYFLLIPRELPKMLPEGESHTEYAEFDKDINSRINNWKRLFARDASGKDWYLPRRELKKLKKEYSEARDVTF